MQCLINLPKQEKEVTVLGIIAKDCHYRIVLNSSPISVSGVLLKKKKNAMFQTKLKGIFSLPGIISVNITFKR